MADCGIPVYLNASWKGMPFYVDSSSDTFGRRGQSYEYPLGEQVAFKDLGRKARKFSVEGYLIGADQVGQTNAMAMLAESPEPGLLVHPMFGPQLVSCIELVSKADYHKEQKVTRLTFDFVEAEASLAPYSAGVAISVVFAAGMSAVAASQQTASWAPVARDVAVAADLSASLARRIAPASDEASYDAIDRLRWADDASEQASATFAGVTDPIVAGTATIRRVQIDSASRLRSWNADVVAAQTGASPSTESLIVTARLALVNDFALVAAQTTYRTIKDAITDLDFAMAVYDEEEAIAASHGDDVLVTAIRAARANAAQAILSRNIRLPGVASTNVDGLWPSLVVAQKLYFDGRRYRDVESYNAQMSPWFIGRDAVALAA